MVERCDDCGFDLAGGLVEVVPTAHYMMGGVEFGADGSTAIRGLFAAGEDTGGVHGANRLGGNGVANSTVFGAIAGDAMAQWTLRAGAWRDPAPGALEDAEARARIPLGNPAGDIEAIREALYEVMWNDVGILRDAAGLARAHAKLEELRGALHETGIAGADLRYNLTWHDWLNLESLLTVSGAIRAAAEARAESRGAHFREDHPHTGDLATSAFSRVTLAGARFDVSWKPVAFSRVRPGQSLIAA
jgi:fumarate reductase flavoprotein subunit